MNSDDFEKLLDEFDVSQCWTNEKKAKYFPIQKKVAIESDVMNMTMAFKAYSQVMKLTKNLK